MGDLTSLIARVEALTGPDKQVDLIVAKCLGAGLEHTPTKFTRKIAWPGDNKCRPCPPYTGCETAALGLLERAFPGSFWQLAKGRLTASEPLYAAQILFGSDEVLGEAEHDTSPAIALILATLKALQAKEVEG